MLHALQGGGWRGGVGAELAVERESGSVGRAQYLMVLLETDCHKKRPIKVLTTS